MSDKGRGWQGTNRLALVSGSEEPHFHSCDTGAVTGVGSVFSWQGTPLLFCHFTLESLSPLLSQLS